MTNTTNTTTFAAAYRAGREQLRAAPLFENRDLREHALVRERRARITAARATFANARPTVAELSRTRDDVLADLAPATADALAVQRRWREKNGGGDGALSEVLARVENAERTGVEALLDDIHTLHPDDAAEVRAAIFGRLVALGDEAAVALAAEESSTAVARAWADALEQAQRGEVDQFTRQAILDADPAGYATAFPEDVVVDWKNIERIETPTLAEVGGR